VQFRGGPDAISVTVENQATPIPSERSATLFEPWKSGQRAGRRNLGLGLYIVDQVVRAHGGRAEVESDERSTRFRLRLAVG
jgi:signal transduction histidine kinase